MARQSFLFEREPEPGGSSIAQVVIQLPVEGTFDYRIPAALADRIVPGVRVRVNFAGRKVLATCTAVSDRSSVQDPREILDLVDQEPLLSTSLLELTRWIASHYHCAWWEAISTALPAAARRGGGFRRILHARLALRVDDALAMADELLEKRPEQSRSLRILAEEGGFMEAIRLCGRANVSRSPLETLKKQGLVALEWIEQEREPIRGLAEPAKGPVTLTDEQAHALEAVVERVVRGPRTDFLLFGVTGSGKTEIYLRAIREVVAQGRQAIVLVPEIALTPQTVARFRHRFSRVAVLHSRLTDAERYSQWRTIRSGTADVVVGARSALFAPVPRLGLIVIDEEHETSFKQQNAPRYHARTVALERGRIEGVPVLLGSATPSLEAWNEVAAGRMELLRLSHRVGGGQFPTVTVLHMGLEKSRGGNFLTSHLCSAVDDTLARQRQVILFLNRRGFHTAIICADCAESVRCTQCDIAMTHHRQSNRVICHYCGHEIVPPPECAHCSSRRLKYIGSGTERIEAEVKRTFPGAAVLRMDSDTMASRNAHEEALESFRKRDKDILIGTQMIAKGLDFPGVSLVGVISADTSLLLPDFRAAERTYQLISQVAGRAGRVDDAGRVIVQTYNPEHYAVRLAVENDYERFAAIELAARSEHGYPPFGHLLRVLFTAEAESDAMRLARSAAATLTQAALPEGTTILGPARAPLTKISGRYRWHLMVKAAEDAAIDKAGRTLRALARESATAGPRADAARMQIDVDPLSML